MGNNDNIGLQTFWLYKLHMMLLRHRNIRGRRLDQVMDVATLVAQALEVATLVAQALDKDYQRVGLACRKTPLV